MSFIVQLPLTSSSRMSSVRNLLINKSNSLFIVPFDDRPGKLFEGLEHCRSVIFLSEARGIKDYTKFKTTLYQRWPTEARENLFYLLLYSPSAKQNLYSDVFPKYSHAYAESILTKLQGQTIVDYEVVTDEHPIYVHRIIGYFVKALDFIPYFWNEAEGQKRSEDYKPFFLNSDVLYALIAVLNSSLFYLFWLVYGDGFHCGYKDVRAFKVGNLRESRYLPILQNLGKELMIELKKSATRKIVFSKATGRVEYDEFNQSSCYQVINEIDRVLAQHYGFTDEELDFIINYDIKYRMGKDSGDEGEE